MENRFGEWWPHICSTFEEACRDVAPEYFKVQRYKAEAAYRERVYCYELYHQLRTKLSRDIPYVLHGELDKRGHDFVERILEAGLKPDFLVHDPGHMEVVSNLLVVEVKSIDKVKQAQSDVEKLSRFFANGLAYGYALCLVYGMNEERFSPYDLRPQSDKIVVAWHRQPGERPVICHGQGCWITEE